MYCGLTTIFRIILFIKYENEIPVEEKRREAASYVVHNSSFSTPLFIPFLHLTTLGWIHLSKAKPVINTHYDLRPEK
jgi:hypothetical protein